MNASRRALKVAVSTVALIAASLSIVAVGAASATGGATTVYSNNFNSAIGSEWSAAAILATPSASGGVLASDQVGYYFPIGYGYLPFDNSDAATLTLTGLPTHHAVTLAVHLYTLRSWDGNTVEWGPDRWDLNATGVSSDIQPVTTFSNFAGKTQDYPGSCAPDGTCAGTNPGATGAAATSAAYSTGMLGLYSSYNGEMTDVRYDLSYSFAHTASSITFTFAGLGLQSWGDEGWVLDNIEVDVVGDTTPPTISITAPADGASYRLGSTVLAGYECADEAGGSGLASCEGTVPDGTAIDTGTVGSKDFTVTAQDEAGNWASLTHPYSVVYDAHGFFAPVDNPPTFNIVKAGAAVPVKFSLSGDQGLAIFAVGYPKTAVTTCSPGVGTDAIEETAATAGSSGLAYDSATDQYTYVWKTQKNWANTCRTLILRFIEGTSMRADFQFT